MEGVAAPGEHHHESQIVDEADGELANLAVVAPSVHPVEGRESIEAFDDVEAEPTPLECALALARVEGDIHD